MSKPIISITIAYLIGLVFGSIFNYFPITVIAAIIFFIIIEIILKRPRSFWNPGAFDYEAYLARKGIYALASIGEKDPIEIIGNTGNIFFVRLFEMRDKIKEAITNS